MPLKVRTLDHRNQLFGLMYHQITCPFPQFFEVRDWCLRHFGPGIEYEHYINYAKSTGKKMPWAWDCNKYQGASISSGKIYLPNDANMYSLFSLTWL